MDAVIGKLIKLLLVLALLVVAAVVVGVFYVDSIVKAAIQNGGAAALGVSTRVESVNIGLREDRLTIKGLSISNPPNYTSPHMMLLESASCQFDLRKLMDETIDLPNFEIDGVDICIEQAMPASNVSAVLEHLKRFRPVEPDRNQPPAKKIKVSQIRVRRVTAHVYVLPGLTPVAPVTIDLGDMVLENAAIDDPKGIGVSELIARVVPQILAEVLERAGGTIPPVLSGPLKADVAQFQRLPAPTAKLLPALPGKTK